MSARWRWCLGLALLLALAIATLRVDVPARQPPRLVVLLVVDQLRADYLERFRDHYVGGFRWLLDHGAHFTEAAYRHSGTVTGAGHATVATGMHPSTHGVIGNSWRESGTPVGCVEDGRYQSVGGPGEGVSPLALKSATVGDRLKSAYPGARVYGFSTKDRSAVLSAGRQADGAFWYQSQCGCLVSSTYYADRLPAWLQRFNDAGPAAAYAGRDWTRLLQEESEYDRLARVDAFPGERATDGGVFPHGRAFQDFESTIPPTPFGDAITLDAALAAVASGEIGTDGSPDLLALGLSATDYIGHRYGPFSHEAMDNHLRLDRALGEFLEAVDAAVGLENTLVVLSADHGAAPLVEHLQSAGVVAERFDVGSLWERARVEVDRCGAGPSEATVDRAGGRSLYWNEDALRERGIEPSEASECLARWIETQRGVEAVFTPARLAAAEPGGTAQLFRNSHFSSRSPQVEVHLKEYFYTGGGTGTGHGTAHAYDRRVPIVLAGPGVVPGRFEAPSGPEDIAPTLGVLLDIAMTVEPDARVLVEALGH